MNPYRDPAKGKGVDVEKKTKIVPWWLGRAAYVVASALALVASTLALGALQDAWSEAHRGLLTAAVYVLVGVGVVALFSILSRIAP